MPELMKSILIILDTQNKLNYITIERHKVNIRFCWLGLGHRHYLHILHW